MKNRPWDSTAFSAEPPVVHSEERCVERPEKELFQVYEQATNESKHVQEPITEDEVMDEVDEQHVDEQTTFGSDEDLKTDALGEVK